MKGKGLAFIGNKTIEFEPGQAFLLGPYLPHNFVSTEEEDVQMEKECWGLQFTQEWLNSFKESASLQRLFRAMRPVSICSAVLVYKAETLLHLDQSRVLFGIASFANIFSFTHDRASIANLDVTRMAC